ncbi:hypothetical protein [Methylocystis bryophila]|uniref:Uncharacterized protein n=1 Tax=Methylocystis bryophila TaxID=655015 RepID=A0A1W6MUA0_9HYPH|nr:hypothetical protein [Methylocystis bryophila]ARN81069.1 hypothetical protein B1812_08255 [Methylocystis bryophila]BDV36993.1 hypothetical protein DSM21852_02460 [Methylocystis bryophila]
MANDIELGLDELASANDNKSPDGEPENETRQKIDKVALTIARLVGRCIAREHYEASRAANDNKPCVDTADFKAGEE